MTREEYNGWTNKQTWNINLTYQDCFEDMAQSQSWDDLDHLADALENLVDELEYSSLIDGSLAQQAVGEYLDRVNWMEIAEHLVADFDLELRDEEEEAEEAVL
jgi:hypothetical protein